MSRNVRQTLLGLGQWTLLTIAVFAVVYFGSMGVWTTFGRVDVDHSHDPETCPVCAGKLRMGKPKPGGYWDRLEKGTLPVKP